MLVSMLVTDPSLIAGHFNNIPAHLIKAGCPVKSGTVRQIGKKWILLCTAEMPLCRCTFLFKQYTASLSVHGPACSSRQSDCGGIDAAV